MVEELSFFSQEENSKATKAVAPKKNSFHKNQYFGFYKGKDTTFSVIKNYL